MIVAGATWPVEGRPEDAYVMKLDPKGNLDSVWGSNPIAFGGPRGDAAYDIQTTPDGGTIIAGYSEASRRQTDDVYLIKLDPEGNLDPAWVPNPRAYGQSWTDESARSIVLTPDGGFITVGWTDARQWRNRDIFLLKLTPSRHVFLRGDCSGDGVVDGPGEAVSFLAHELFGGSSPPCLAACDVNGDGKVTGSVLDGVYLLSHFLLGSAPPEPPYPECGAGQHWTDGPLGCEIEPECP